MRTSNFPRNKARKQTEAKARQAHWTSLELSLQLAELDTRPGNSARQRARIQKQLQEQKKK